MADLESRRKRILQILSVKNELSCSQITNNIIDQEILDIPEAQRVGYKKVKYHYTSGSVSSILNKLVKENILEYSEKTTDRGGHIYKLK